MNELKIKSVTDNDDDTFNVLFSDGTTFQLMEYGDNWAFERYLQLDELLDSIDLNTALNDNEAWNYLKELFPNAAVDRDVFESEGDVFYYINLTEDEKDKFIDDVSNTPSLPTIVKLTLEYEQTVPDHNQHYMVEFSNNGVIELRGWGIGSSEEDWFFAVELDHLHNDSEQQAWDAIKELYPNAEGKEFDENGDGFNGLSIVVEEAQKLIK